MQLDLFLCAQRSGEVEHQVVEISIGSVPLRVQYRQNPLVFVVLCRFEKPDRAWALSQQELVNGGARGLSMVRTVNGFDQQIMIAA